MKLPLSWLNDFVQVDDIPPKELADKLLNIGFEVEEIIYTGQNIENVVVGKILDIKKHNEADKLQVCMVDVCKEITTIVTGANNINVGDLIPVALDGAMLPSGKRIQASTLRGVMSFGMMCSGSELNIDNYVVDGAEVDGILILPPDFVLGQDIKEALGLNQYIFDVSVLSNRPDCQSIYGLAREVGAVLNRKVKALNLKYKTVESEKTIPQVKIIDYDLCSKYTGRLVDAIKIEASPKWLRDRLLMVGIRPINNIVDITNYVLVEVGQPLHAFDVTLIDNEIVVRRAATEENIVALDGKKYVLDNNMLVIADSNKPLAIAGIMGGEFSGIKQQTEAVFLEAARFSRGCIRSASRALGLRSDSSARYEKGVDALSVDLGRERALSLIYNLKVGKILNLECEDKIKASDNKIITTSVEQISKLLGIDIKLSVMVKILKALEIEVETKNDVMICKIPLFREDIDNFTDLAEEVIRFYGYDNIQSTFLKTASTTKGGIEIEEKNIDDIKQFMCGMGGYEIITYSFINNNAHDKLNLPKDSLLRDVISIKNPLSEEYAVMRTQMISSMLSTIYLNINRKNNDFRLFEVGKTYIPKQLPLIQLPNEFVMLSMGLVGEKENFYTIKNIIETLLTNYKIKYIILPSKNYFLHPGISADIIVDGECIGCFGEVHPQVAENFSINTKVYIGEIKLEKLISNQLEFSKFVALPKYPLVERDLAIIISDEFTIGEIANSIVSFAGELCEKVELFDIYKGEQIESGYKSVAFNLKLRSANKTLVDMEVQQVMASIIEGLKNTYNAKLR